MFLKKEWKNFIKIHEITCKNNFLSKKNIKHKRLRKYACVFYTK